LLDHANHRFPLCQQLETPYPPKPIKNLRLWQCQYADKLLCRHYHQLERGSPHLWILLSADLQMSGKTTEVCFHLVLANGSQHGEAVMTGGWSGGVVLGPCRNRVPKRVYLDVTHYLESCDTDLWKTFVEAAKSARTLDGPTVLLQHELWLDDEIRDLCHDITEKFRRLEPARLRRLRQFSPGLQREER